MLGITVISRATFMEFESDSTVLWHMRLKHMGEHGIKKLHNRNLLKRIKICKLKFCKYYVFGKQNRVQFKTITYNIKEILDYVHIDVFWGPTRITSQKGHNYFMTFINDYSRKVWMYFMKYKS